MAPGEGTSASAEKSKSGSPSVHHGRGRGRRNRHPGRRIPRGRSGRRRRGRVACGVAFQSNRDCVTAFLNQPSPGPSWLPLRISTNIATDSGGFGQTDWKLCNRRSPHWATTLLAVAPGRTQGLGLLTPGDPSRQDRENHGQEQDTWDKSLPERKCLARCHVSLQAFLHTLGLFKSTMPKEDQ